MFDGRILARIFIFLGWDFLIEQRVEAARARGVDILEQDIEAGEVEAGRRIILRRLSNARDILERDTEGGEAKAGRSRRLSNARDILERDTEGGEAKAGRSRIL